MKTIEELSAAIDAVGAQTRVVMPLFVKIPLGVRPFFQRLFDFEREANTIMFDRHLALCNALEFALAMKYDANIGWHDEQGNVWEPSEDIAFLVKEAQERAARAAAPPVKPS